LTVILITVFVQSCRSISTMTGREEYFTGRDIFENIMSNRAKMDSYSAGRFIIRINDNDEELSFRGAVRLKRDSAIMLTINVIAGIEAARILITPDSIKMIDRINNNYFLGNYQDALKIFPFMIDYHMIQGIFLASPERLIEGYDMLSDRRKRYTFEGDVIIIRTSGNGLTGGDREVTNSNAIQLLVDRNFLTRSIEYYSGEDNIFASLKYNSFSNTGGYALPDDITLNFVSHNLPFLANVKLSRLEINKEMTFPFRIPPKYTRVHY
jgi:hypothetical protein